MFLEQLNPGDETTKGEEKLTFKPMVESTTGSAYSEIENPETGDGYGAYLTYRNNGAELQEDLTIYVNVTIEYLWGSFTTEKVAIPVKAKQ